MRTGTARCVECERATWRARVSSTHASTAPHATMAAPEQSMPTFKLVLGASLAVPARRRGLRAREAGVGGAAAVTDRVPALDPRSPRPAPPTPSARATTPSMLLHTPSAPATTTAGAPRLAVRPRLRSFNLVRADAHTRSEQSATAARARPPLSSVYAPTRRAGLGPRSLY